MVDQQESDLPQLPQLDRRTFVAGGVCAALAAATPGAERSQESAASARAGFPRLADEAYLNAAGATPLGTAAQAGLERHMDLLRYGPGEGRQKAFAEMLGDIRGLFGTMIGARASEIALVHCTKAGEQIVLDGLDPLSSGRNVVTNDLHFSGSLHNLVGLGKRGVDVRIVRNRNWDVSLERMKQAIDDRTALVSVSLVSNVNGKVEGMRQLADVAHAHGAFMYADIIQAAGIVPLDVRALGIDFAAANGYKWLYGTYGAGFFFVREEHQGSVLPDRLFPGRARGNYPPWTVAPDVGAEAFRYRAPHDASRYEPGHVAYLAYSGVYEGLRMLQDVGVENALAHSVRLNRRLRDHLDLDRYPCITPEPDRSAINSFRIDGSEAVAKRLEAARVTVSLSPRYLRVSPALYNNEDDIDRLVKALEA